MLTRLRHLLELIRFSHTIFALPFALLAAVMAWTAPSASGERADFRWTHLAGILVCMVGARSAAMAFCSTERTFTGSALPQGICSSGAKLCCRFHQGWRLTARASRANTSEPRA